MGMDYPALLGENQSFRSDYPAEIKYVFSCKEYESLEKEYGIRETAGKGSTFLQAVNLLEWVNKNIRHKGNYDNSDPQDALHLLSLAYIKDNTGINCLSMSIILSECLLASGIYARVVYMMPKAADDGDNHVVAEAFIAEWNKWIMLDPTYGSYCCDSSGEVLNLYEIRKRIINDEEYFFSDKLNYNGETVSDLADLKEYYAKNLFFLRSKARQGYGMHREYGDMVEMAPINFDVHERMLLNLQYRIHEYGECDLFTDWMSYESQLDNRYVDIESFYEPPCDREN